MPPIWGELTIQSQKARKPSVIRPIPPNAGHRSGVSSQQPRYEETSHQVGRVPISGHADATAPGDNAPRIMRSTGAISHAGPGDQHPHHRGHEEGKGGLPGPGVVPACWPHALRLIDTPRRTTRSGSTCRNTTITYFIVDGSSDVVRRVRNYQECARSHALEVRRSGAGDLAQPSDETVDVVVVRIGRQTDPHSALVGQPQMTRALDRIEVPGRRIDPSVRQGFSHVL